MPTADPGSRGLLDPQRGRSQFQLSRVAPAADLADLVERHWLVRWDLRGRPPYASQTLPFPSVNLAIGTHRPGLHGVCTTRFVAYLEGEGWVLGTKFRSGGFRPFLDRPVCELTDREFELAAMFGPAGDELDRAVHAADDDEARIALVSGFLRARRAPDPDALEAIRIAELAQADRSILRVADLARASGVSVRRMERLFRSHVGVGPKWVIRRFRVQEAADRAGTGQVTDWSALAAELGYFDQAHLIREFRAQIGRTPAEYAALCAAATPQRSAGPLEAPDPVAAGGHE